MDYFHTQLFYKLSLVLKEKVRFKAVIRCKRTSIACQKRMASTRKSKIQDHHFQVIWILCEPSRVPGGLELPKALAEKMLVATRFKQNFTPESDTAFDSVLFKGFTLTQTWTRESNISSRPTSTSARLSFTQNDTRFSTTCSFQDETNFARMLSSVEKYAGRRPEETWGELQSRSSYKELVRQKLFRNHS